MKKIMILVLMGLALMGCSSGSSDSKPSQGGGGVTEFHQKISGQWLSDCSQNQTGLFKETLIVNSDGTGSRTTNWFEDQNCTRAAQVATPENFTYPIATAVNGQTPVTLTFADGQKAQVNVSVQGDNLEITSDQGTVHYSRQVLTTIPSNPNNFDASARGNWITEQCYEYDNNQTARQVLTINGQGRGASVLNVYTSGDCSGTPHAEQHQDITYTVDRFANGGGQISINGNPFDISFQENKMTVSGATATTVYIKIN